jgi:predicted SnoaL-like aldol condensation-catalyzing enzyme
LQEYTVVGGIAQISDPAFFETWMHREDFAEAMSQAATPEAAAIKRLVWEFEAALARMVIGRRVEEEVDEILERFLVENYIQHDPNVPGNGRAILAAGFRKIPLNGDVPPPPVALIVDGDLVCLMMQKPMPDPAAPGSMYDWFIPTIFRVRDGKLAEHWGPGQKGNPGMGPSPEMGPKPEEMGQKPE